MKLEIGYNSNFEVRKEHFSGKVAGVFSIVYLSDFHFTGYSGELSLKIAEKIEELNPDILLLGGTIGIALQVSIIFVIL